MANHDVRNDPAPQNTNKQVFSPKVSSLRTALNGFSATSYPNSRLDDMTNNDMEYAARVHGLTTTNPV